MLLALRRTLNAIILISAFASGNGQAMSQAIQGNCNVVAEQLRVASSFTINCNNISNQVRDEILTLLSQIETITQSGDQGEIAEALRSLASNAEDALNELINSRAPEITLSRSHYRVCQNCNDDLEFISTGGNISRFEEYTLREVALVQAQTGGSCPFRFQPFEQNWIDIDRGSSIWLTYVGQAIPTGEALAVLPFSGMARSRALFEEQVFENLNEQLQIAHNVTITRNTFDICTTFFWRVAIEFIVQNNSGSRVYQYFFFDFEEDVVGGQRLSIERAPFLRSRSDFEEVVERFEDARRQRRTMADFGYAAFFLREAFSP